MIIWLGLKTPQYANYEWRPKCAKG